MPGPLDGRLQGQDAVDVDAVPAAERGPPDHAPEVAAGEAGAAAAPLVVAQVALPEVDDLAERAHVGQLGEHALEQRGAAAPEPAEKENACHFPHFQSFLFT